MLQAPPPLLEKLRFVGLLSGPHPTSLEPSSSRKALKKERRGDGFKEEEDKKE
jgi:hypothetical protein